METPWIFVFFKFREQEGGRVGRENISLLLLASKWMFSQNQNQILACRKGARDQQELLNHWEGWFISLCIT